MWSRPLALSPTTPTAWSATRRALLSAEVLGILQEGLRGRPCAAVEVLSPSAEAWERGGELELHGRVEGLSDCLARVA